MNDFALWASIGFSAYRHLRLVSRKRAAILGAMVCLFELALILPMRYANIEQNREKLGELEIPSSLRSPWMRVADGVTPEKFFE